MKKLIIALLILPIGVFGQNEKKLDDKNGFKKYTFGSPLENYPNLKPQKDIGWYTSLTDTLTIGDYKLESISYEFYKKQLCTICIHTKGFVNSRGVLSVLQKAYGTGYQPNEYIEEFLWSGKIVTMLYDENSLTNDVVIFISSNELTGLKEKEKEQTDKKATDGL